MNSRGVPMSTYRWTQPSCEPCFREHHPRHEPYRFRYPEAERCVYCGVPTTDGIYVRVNPERVPHPTLTEDA